MRWTNRLNLPEWICRPIQRSWEAHDPQADYSVTQLINPPQMRVLLSRYHDKVVVDYADQIWAFFGSCMHAVLAREEIPGAIKEQRVFLTVPYEGRTISVSGQPDVVNTLEGIIEDYKFTSVFAYQKGKLEWEQQLNSYVPMVETAHKMAVRGLKVWGALRDHMDSQVIPGGDYPPEKLQCTIIPVWEKYKAFGFLQARVAAHEQAKQLFDEDLPPCLGWESEMAGGLNEMWEKPEGWAIKKAGAKAAYRVLQIPGQAGNEAACELALRMNKGKMDGPYGVEHRPGRRVRCEKYCQAAPFCHQFKQYQSVAWNKSGKEPNREPEGA